MANLITTSISALNGTATAGPLDNFGTAGVIISGTWTGTLTFEGSLNGTDFVTILVQNLTTNLLVTSTITNGQFIVNTAGLHSIRVKMTSYTSGTANIVIQANAAMYLQRSLATISGATDGTTIGNVTDRLKVDAQVTSISGGLNLTTSKKLRYDDMNASTGGIARNTALTVGTLFTLYSYTGSGIITGFLVTIEASSSSAENYEFHFIVDGEEIFNTTGINSRDMIDNQLYNFNTAGTREPSLLGMEMTDSTTYFSTSPNFPIKYDTSVEVKVKHTVGNSAKRFWAGLILLTKET